MNQVRELQMQTLLSAMSAKDSPLGAGEMRQAVDRMVMIHGQGFRVELDDRLRRIRAEEASDIGRGRFRNDRSGYDDYEYDRRRRDPFDDYGIPNSRDYGPNPSRPLQSRSLLRPIPGTPEDRRRQLRDSAYPTSRSDGGWRPQVRGRNEGGADRQRRDKYIQRGVVLLFPNPPDVALPSLSPKPPGCTTVYIGGLPPRCLERHIRDAFSDCGRIKGIRIGRGKGFAHVEYDDGDSVDRAVGMSGWRIKVDRTQHPDAIGRMHVDYAHDRKKQQEQKSKQDDGEKVAEKDSRKRRYSIGDSDSADDEAPAKKQRSSTEAKQEKSKEVLDATELKRITNQSYSDEASADLREQLACGEQFLKPCSQQILKWLNDDKCTESTRDDFFSLLQAMQSHIKRLEAVKKSQHDAADSFQQRMAHQHDLLLRQAGYVENVLEAANSEKLEDVFSKGQLKSLSIWLSTLKTLKADATEMAVADQLEPSAADKISVDDVEKDESTMNKEERAEYWKERHSAVEQQVKLLQAKMARLRHQCREVLQHKMDEVTDLKASLSKVVKEETEEKAEDSKGEGNQLSWADQTSFLSDEDFSGTGYNESVLTDQGDCDEESLNVHPCEVEDDMLLLDEDVQPVVSAASSLSNESAALVSVAVAYLIVHPFGASLADIFGYMKGLGCTAEQDTIEELLSSLPLVFRCDVKEEASLWVYCGFQTIGLPLKTAAQCAIAGSDDRHDS